MDQRIVIRVNEVFGKDSVREWSDDFSGLGVGLDVVEYPNDQYGAFEWLIPTGIVLFITKPYFETMLQEAAKDHYGAIKKVLGEKVFKRCFGKSSEKLVRVTSKGPRKDGYFSSTFSIATHARADGDGPELKLLLREKSTGAEIEEAFSKFAALIGASEQNLLQGIMRYHNSALHSIVFWLNPNTGEVELLDVVKSSMDREVVSIPLDIDLT